MNFYTKQLLSIFLMFSLMSVFISCTVICAEVDDCANETEVSIAESASFDEPILEDSCPIKAATKMTTPERILLEIASSEIPANVSTGFLLTAVSPDSFKYQPNFYRPPNINPPSTRTFVFRI